MVIFRGLYRNKVKGAAPKVHTDSKITVFISYRIKINVYVAINNNRFFAHLVYKKLLRES